VQGQGLALLTEKERPSRRLQAGDVQHPALDVHLLENEAAVLRHPQPMTEHQQEQATVTGLIGPIKPGFFAAPLPEDLRQGGGSNQGSSA